MVYRREMTRWRVVNKDDDDDVDDDADEEDYMYCYADVDVVMCTRWRWVWSYCASSKFALFCENKFENDLFPNLFNLIFSIIKQIW